MDAQPSPATPMPAPGAAKPRRPRLSRNKKLAFAAVALLSLIVLPLAAVEIGGRLAMWWKHGVPGKSYGLYQADPVLGATHAPHGYNANAQTNNWGFRNVEDVAAAKPAGALRVYCSGGSTTFCYNLSNAEAWPARLEERLRKDPGGKADEVLNAGQICFAVAQEFELARRQIPALKPDVALLYTGINEGLAAQTLAQEDGKPLDGLLKDERWGLCPLGLDQARFWKRNSMAVRLWDYKLKGMFAAKRTAAFRGAAPPPDEARAFNEHPYVLANQTKTLTEYLRFLKREGVVPVVVRFGDNGSDMWYHEHGIRPWRENAVRVARAEGVAVADLATAMERRPDRKACFIESGLHVTALGADVVAAELHRFLRERFPAKAR